MTDFLYDFITLFARWISAHQPHGEITKKKCLILKSKFNVDDDDPFQPRGGNLFFHDTIHAIFFIVWVVIKDSCRWMILQKSLKSGRAICCSVKQRQLKSRTPELKVPNSVISVVISTDSTLMGNCFFSRAGRKLLHNSSQTVVNVRALNEMEKLIWKYNFLVKTLNSKVKIK